MMTRNRKFLITGLIIALIIGVLSPFISSQNPDGLQKSTEQLNPNIKDPGYYHPPMADYKVPGFGDSPLAGILALVIGALIVFVFAYMVSLILKRRKPPETSKSDET